MRACVCVFESRWPPNKRSSFVKVKLKNKFKGKLIRQFVTFIYVYELQFNKKKKDASLCLPKRVPVSFDSNDIETRKSRNSSGRRSTSDLDENRVWFRDRQRVSSFDCPSNRKRRWRDGPQSINNFQCAYNRQATPEKMRTTSKSNESIENTWNRFKQEEEDEQDESEMCLSLDRVRTTSNLSWYFTTKE